MEPYAAAKGGGADAGTGLEGLTGPTSAAQLGFRCVRGGFAALLLPAHSLGFWISDATAWTRRVLTVDDAFAESMRRLGLGEDGEAGEEKLPERPGEADCAYYLRTGACGFGERCRYNHPRDRGGTEVSAGGRFFSAALCFPRCSLAPSLFPDLIRVRVRGGRCCRRIIPFQVDSLCD